MHRRVRTTTTQADVRDIAKQMLTNKWGCIPVVNGKSLVGIVTASDFLRLSINLLSLYENFAKQVSKPPF
jgi:CBS domain-containing membrane protein